MRWLVIVGLLTAGAAVAHSGATGIVKERMDGMKDMSHAAKALGAMRAGAIPVEIETYRRAGAEIAARGRQALTLFPAGSDGGVSEASPAIWSDRAEFDRVLDAMIRDADALAAIESVEAAAPIAEKIAAACKDCHDRFRLRK